MAIQSTAIGATNTTIYTAADDVAISTMIFCNTSLINPLQDDADTTYLDIHLVKNGQTPTTTNKIVNALEIPASETVFFDTERIVLETGDYIVAVSTSPAVLVCTISTVLI